MSDFFETIYAQRAIRKFKPDEIPLPLIENIIDAATYIMDLFLFGGANKINFINAR